MIANVTAVLWAAIFPVSLLLALFVRYLLSPIDSSGARQGFIVLLLYGGAAALVAVIHAYMIAYWIFGPTHAILVPSHPSWSRMLVFALRMIAAPLIFTLIMAMGWTLVRWSDSGWTSKAFVFGVWIIGLFLTIGR